MSFKENLTNFFYTKEPVSEPPKNKVSGSDKYLIDRFPCLENTKALEVYKSFVLHAGRCPECNDHLFPEISLQDDGSYNLVKKCMDRNCNYKLDVSEDFNNHMGIKTQPVKKEPKKRKEKKKEPVKIKNPGSVYWSLMTKDNLSNPMADAPSKVMREVSEAIGECPICHHNEFDINIEYKIEVKRYEAIGICENCQSVFDVTDFVAVAGYGEFPDILQRDYNLTGWSDCKLRFLWKMHTPKNTGHLKYSVKRALENRDVHGKKESDEEKESDEQGYGGKMYIQGF